MLDRFLMNTPSHAIINLAILGKPERRQFNLAIVLGGIVPDIPIFIFFFWMRFVAQMPASQIWTEGYFQPFWQDLIATFHSIPLAVIGIAISYIRQWNFFVFLLTSMVLHDLLDLPVHHDDAHRHFFPFSNYRFISPISYWDRRYYGDIVALVEILLVLISTIYGFRLVRSRVGKTLMVLVNVFYAIGYVFLYLSRN